VDARAPLRRSPLLLVAAAGLALGCGRCGGKPAPRAAPPHAVAVVNGEAVPAEALARELARARAAGAEGAAPDAALKRRLLDDAVDRTLLLQAARERSIAVGQDQVERALLRLRAEYPGTHFDDMLAGERLSEPELRARLKEQLTLEKLFAEEVFPRVQVTDAEVERYYTEHAAEFEQAEQVRASQVVTRTKEEAQKVRDELRRRPPAFADVARRRSIAPEARQGGDLGWFGRGSGMPEVFEVCFKLPMNAISDVTPSPYGFHVFKVTARRPALRRAFAEVQGQIRDRLAREKRSQAQDAYLAALRARAQVTIDEKALGAVAP
jgi:peptidyl-prolyl cis-trans isomerase C